MNIVTIYTHCFSIIYCTVRAYFFFAAITRKKDLEHQKGHLMLKTAIRSSTISKAEIFYVTGSLQFT